MLSLLYLSEGAELWGGATTMIAIFTGPIPTRGGVGGVEQKR